MKSLQIKDLPAHIYQRLVELAETERRSLAQQAVIALAKGLDLRPESGARRQAVLKKIKTHKIEPELRDFRAKLPDPVLLVRESRGFTRHD